MNPNPNPNPNPSSNPNRHGGESTSRVLLLSGASVNLARPTGATSMHEAAAAGHEAVVRLLIREGAEV